MMVEYQFEKELFHAHGDTAQFPTFEEPKYLWPKGSGIPPAEWIGFKFIVKTLNEGSVLLELYLDLTDGKNGGEWKKVLEYKDKGQWYAEAEDGYAMITHITKYCLHLDLSL